VERSTSSGQLHGVFREAFKFRHRSESRNQSLVEQPGGRALNAISVSSYFGLCDSCGSTAVGKRSMERREVNTGPARVPVNHCWILKVLAQDKVRCEEFFV
jgi:hypothetical protein